MCALDFKKHQGILSTALDALNSFQNRYSKSCIIFFHATLPCL